MNAFGQDYFVQPTQMEGMGMSMGVADQDAMFYQMPANATPRRPSAALQAAAVFSPLLGDLRTAANAAQNRNQAAAMGQTDFFGGAMLAGSVALGILFRGGAGYVVGKAIAPSSESESAYAWGSALGAVFFGALGLGVAGLIALSQRR